MRTRTLITPAFLWPWFAAADFGVQDPMRRDENRSAAAVRGSCTPQGAFGTAAPVDQLAMRFEC
jgi:hypothetical protein